MRAALGLLLLSVLLLACGYSAKKSVLIIGAGIGGLTSAHELVDRNFTVTVFERGTILGGKARSMKFTNSGTQGRKDLDSEHGFRFFPGFYQHIPDSMQRTPFGQNKTVFQNLVYSDYDVLANLHGKPWIFPVHLPKNYTNFIKDLVQIFKFKELGIPEKEFLYFCQRILVLASTCDARWDTEYDKYDWWTFMHADNLSHAYKQYLVIGITADILAAKAKITSLKTIGRTFIRLLESAFINSFDRVLNGPTNEVWINSWQDYIESKGGKFVTNVEAVSFNFDGDQITGVNFVDRATGKTFTATADYYISSIPVEKMAKLVTTQMAKKAPSLSYLGEQKVEWMNGIQFYLKRSIPQIPKGHLGFFDSPYMLTALTQQQFWPNVNLSNYGDGSVRDILSVDISDWNTPGFIDGPSKGLPAKNCSLQQIVDETWYQMSLHLPDWIPKDMSSIVESWFFDPDIKFTGINNTRVSDNEEPLLINVAGSWNKRPNAQTEIKNLLLAADYVKTATDVACMEAANEAGRIAVNSILLQEDQKNLAKIFTIPWPKEFKLEQDIDCIRFKMGLEPLGWNYPVPTLSQSNVEARKLFNSFLSTHKK